MYYVKYGDIFIHNPLSDNDMLFDASSFSEVNAFSTFDFSIAPTHTYYNKLRERDVENSIFVLFDEVEVFRGYIYKITTENNLVKRVSCKSDISFLGDSIVRPYMTYTDYDDDGEPITDIPVIPGKVDALFNYLIEQHNLHVDENKRFTVGINQGSMLNNSRDIFIASSSFNTTADEIQNNILNTYGGYIFIRHENGIRYIDLLSDHTSVNSQIIDFGKNIKSFEKEMSYDETYNVIYAEGGIPDPPEPEEGEEPEEMDPVTLADLPDGPYSSDVGYYKQGDVVINSDSVAKYGKIEYYYSNPDIFSPIELLDDAVKTLKVLVKPLQALEIRAIDLALFMPGYKHLQVAQLARVRAYPYDVDSYMLVTRIDYDFDDPSNTEYTFGVFESDLVKDLNAKINKNADAVNSLSDDTKAAAELAIIASGEAIGAADAAEAAAIDAAEAQAAAESASSLAGDKRRVFTSTPTPPYDVGDLWVQGSTGDIKVCQTAKTEGQSYSASDWVLSSKYTDDTVAEGAQQAADNAYSMAESAGDMAIDAQEAAEEAAKVATNYLAMDPASGLVVGNMEGTTLGGNVRLQATPSVGLFLSTIRKLLIDTTAMFIFKNDGNSLGAAYGESFAFIGDETGMRIEIDSSGVRLYNANNQQVASYATSILIGTMDSYSIEIQSTGVSFYARKFDEEAGEYVRVKFGEIHLTGGSLGSSAGYFTLTGDGISLNASSLLIGNSGPTTGSAANVFIGSTTAQSRVHINRPSLSVLGSNVARSESLESWISEVGSEITDSGKYQWIYYKYADGRAEAFGWLINNLSYSVNVPYGAIYDSSEYGQATYPSGLFKTGSSAPPVICTPSFKVTNSAYFLSIEQAFGDNTQTPRCFLTRATSASITGHWMFHAIGRWK